MMRMGQMVERGRMREYDASVMVGQRFANEYVAPVANSTSTTTNQSGSEGQTENTEENTNE